MLTFRTNITNQEVYYKKNDNFDFGKGTAQKGAATRELGNILDRTANDFFRMLLGLHDYHQNPYPPGATE
jgi:hypothetical protein